MPVDVPWLGQRIREERLRRSLSLRGLARDVGVSASMISQIETGKSQPSVSTLYAITSTLGISIEHLFAAPSASPSPGADEAAPVSTVDDRGGGPGMAATALLRGTRLGPRVEPAARRVLTLDTGVTWELLGELPRRAVDFLHITYPPGGSSSGSSGLMRHTGAEYGFVLRGELVLTLGFEEYHLRAGDAVSFESSTPHNYRNEGTEPAEGVWFVLERDR